MLYQANNFLIYEKMVDLDNVIFLNFNCYADSPPPPIGGPIQSSIFCGVHKSICAKFAGNSSYNSNQIKS